MDNLTLYSHRVLELTPSLISKLTDDADVQETDDGVIVKWKDVSVTIHHMPSGTEQAEHLDGFQGYIRSCAGKNVESVQELINMIGAVEAVYGCEIEPGFDRGNKAKSLLVSLAATLEECFMFYEGGILSPFGEVWFGPRDMKPLADLSDLKVCKADLNTYSTGSPDQKDRFARVTGLMSSYGVPELMKRVWVDDVEAESLRTPQEVARRILALHAVVCIARGRPREETMEELNASGAQTALSPEEQAFLDHAELPEDERQSMIWKLEVLWVLMWSLRHIDKFTWPNEMCPVEALHELIFEKSKDPKAFIEKSELRSKRSILDACQLIIQLQAVIRSAHLDGTKIPENLNWKKPDRQVLVRECPSVGIVAERHYALNWLRKYQDADWDDVDVPTMPYAILE